MWLWNGGDSEEPTDEEDFSEAAKLQGRRGSAHGTNGARGTNGAGGAIHFQISDDGAPPRAAELELDAMYDFSYFSEPHTAAAEGPSHSVPSRDVVFTKLQEQQQAMEKHMEAQEKKLSSASKALKRSRAQVQQLTAQLSMKDIDCQKLETQVAQLRNLLVEKERRLQEALDSCEAPTSLTEFREPFNDAGGSELVELTRVTEQLTSMLNVMQRQLSVTSSELIVERRRREELNANFAVLEARADVEPAKAASAEERARRVAVEEHLRQATTKKGGRFYPHLEV